jgi:hypothetical protein
MTSTSIGPTTRCGNFAIIRAVNSVASSSDIDFSTPVKGGRIGVNHGPIEDGGVIAVIDTEGMETKTAGGGAQVNVQVKCAFGYSIAFDRDGPGRGDGVTWLIEEELLPYVEAVVFPKFLQFFD